MSLYIVLYDENKYFLLYKRLYNDNKNIYYMMWHINVYIHVIHESVFLIIKTMYNEKHLFSIVYIYNNNNMLLLLLSYITQYIIVI